jgi:PRTRC genetic system ThiF family protein
VARRTYRLHRGFKEPTVVIVGCGGTGGFVAAGVCRLLHGREARITLVDYDRVEPHNLFRQAFYEGDVGQFKAQVLAERLARNYGREIGYSVYPWTQESHQGLFRYGTGGLILGCVDNPAARHAIAEGYSDEYSYYTPSGNLQMCPWWVDAGNSEHSGQVRVGNAKSPVRAFYKKDGICTHLPLPTVQEPGLLLPAPEPAAPAMDCAEAVTAGDQSATINQAMATLVLEMVSRILMGNLTYLAALIDLELGFMRTIPAGPATVARMTGQDEQTLMAKGSSRLPQPCTNCGRIH